MQSGGPYFETRGGMFKGRVNMRWDSGSAFRIRWVTRAGMTRGWMENDRGQRPETKETEIR